MTAKDILQEDSLDPPSHVVREPLVTVWMAAITIVLVVLAAIYADPARAVTFGLAGQDNFAYLPAILKTDPKNLIVNPEFDLGQSGWELGVWGGAAGWAVDASSKLSGSNSARVSIVSPGSENWHIQLRQPRLVESGKVYQIWFMAQASSERTIQVVIQQEHSSWITRWSQDVDITTSAAAYGPYNFCSSVTDLDTNIEFYLGSTAGDVYIDRVAMVEELSHSSTGSALELWDDFDYLSSSDCRLALHGWTVRVGDGGPGQGAPTWSADNIVFVDDAGNKLMRLSATNSGSGSVSSQAQVYTTAKKFLYGTYAARVYFNNMPSAGLPDGDGVVQVFFSITENTPPCSDYNYGELDFEYLPNGGFGYSDGIARLWNTSWDRCYPIEYQQDIYQADYSGWHALMMQVSSSAVKYYVDGILMASHSSTYTPEVAQNINFNLWFWERLADATSRTYQQDVDWVYFGQDMLLSPVEVNTKIDSFRISGVTFKDTVLLP